MTNSNPNPIHYFFPIVFAFFMTGFTDIIGMSVNYCANDFSQVPGWTLSLLASSCFIWFVVASVPVGLLMNKIGRRKVAVITALLNALAFILVTCSYNVYTVFISFSILGLGNAGLQVSLNPLTIDVAPAKRLSAYLSIGQLARALCSIAGPILVSFFAGRLFGNWRLVFVVYAILSVIGFLWLLYTKIQELPVSNESETSFVATFKLLGDKIILACFFGIFVLIGVDVSINTFFPKYLQGLYGISLNDAALGNTVYFAARIIGCLAGSALLTRFKPKNFFLVSTVLAFAALLGMMSATSEVASLASLFIFGIGFSNMFAIIIFEAMHRKPQQANGVSALMIMGICGGAFLPPLVSYLSNYTASIRAGIAVIAVAWLYMIFLSILYKKTHNVA